MTRGMSLPLGAFVSVKEPSVPVNVAVIGFPEGVPHWSHETPWLMGSRVEFGT